MRQRRDGQNRVVMGAGKGPIRSRSGAGLVAAVQEGKTPVLGLISLYR